MEESFRKLARNGLFLKHCGINAGHAILSMRPPSVRFLSQCAFDQLLIRKRRFAQTIAIAQNIIPRNYGISPILRWP
jgi:hypothetical protein